MHLAPADLTSVRQDGLSIRFGILGPIAYALANVPSKGSADTALERPCTRPHWGFVLAGDVTLHQAGRRVALPVGHAFHIAPGGPEHHFEASGGAVISGFETVDKDVDASVAALEAAGYEIVEPDSVPMSVVPTTSHPVEPGRIDAVSYRMTNLVLTRTRMGATSGYTTDWCDVQHWGMVTAGRIAIEWEGDIEVLGTGDIYYCPPGPPGHRISAADPATIVDLTPLAGLEQTKRVADWRRSRDDADRRPAAGGLVEVAALV